MKTLPIGLALAAGLLVTVLGAKASSSGTPAKARIGTYDNRAIAVAYAASRFSPVPQRMEELRAAQAAHDDARVKELNAWGEAHQRSLHRQGFGRVPVDDLLDCVRASFPQVARDAGVDAIAWGLDFAGEGVERVDVTDALVALYEPSAKTRATIRELLERKPISLDELEKLGSDE